MSASVLNPATTLAEMIDVLADLPLDLSSRDVMGILGRHRRTCPAGGSRQRPAIRSISFKSRIFGPLGMVDTGFVVPEKDQGTACCVLCRRGPDGADEAGTHAERIIHRIPALICARSRGSNGGGGLVSTLPDMVALIRSLLPGGPTLLKPETIAQMMTNQLPDGAVDTLRADWASIRGKGFGLAGGLDPEAFAARSARCDQANSIGADWRAHNGGFRQSATWPGMMMTQRQMSILSSILVQEFKRLAYEAVKRGR